MVPMYKNQALQLTKVSPLIIVAVQVKKLYVTFCASGCAFLQWFWFVLVAMEPTVLRDSRAEVCLLPRLAIELANGRLGMSRLCLCRLARIFGKWLLA
jgi:hypothetical protein